MVRTIGFMATWTTYGTWLHVEKKGFVNNSAMKGDFVWLY